MKSVSEVLPNMSYGGDYNPEQWSEDVWYEDARLMKQAGVNLVSVGIFSWAMLEREEGVFDFEWLDKILDILYDHGVNVCLATATASTPAWMAKKYPNSLAVDKHLVPYSIGSRQHYSPNSKDYIRHIRIIVRKLAERYKDHPGLKMWHINNEYACHVSECYSEESTVAFRDWLQKRYETIDELNDRWGTSFWSQRYNNWEEIELPRNPATFVNPGQKLDYKRFMDDAIFHLYKTEKAIVNEVTPDVPVFTNFMIDFKPLDYFKWAKELDVVTWDSYPDPRDGVPYTHAMWHDLMRSLKQGQPFFLMEQVTGQVNWRDINLLKKPNVMRLWSYSTVARGGDGIMFFQWRQSRAGAEKFHGAMIPHSGEESRIYQEVKQLGNELKKLDSVIGTRVPAKVGIVFDWENWWAIELEGKPNNNLDYLQQVQSYYKELYTRNISVEFVQAGDDLSKFEVVIAPMLYMVKPGDRENLESFVSRGGTLLVSYFSGIVDENDRIHLGGYASPLKKLLGISIEEFSPYAEGEKSYILQNSEKIECSVWTDIIHLEKAKALATFGKEWYKGMPAVTQNQFGQGKAIYVGTQPEPGYIGKLLETVTAEKGIKPLIAQTPPNVEVLERNSKEAKHVFILNHNENDIVVDMPTDKKYINLLTNEEVQASVQVKAVDVAILKAL
ncbi:beta-galactosidase [Halalkalibacter okhensis]|uniref:Beta-galactosidase n=1 Tax=Halalkalibacter okhensis TaxID=333138 RepID=A0A0B0IAI9_9BACI|nr:beta-galactosidase [Halalkalibacter okhensis]KHF39583.1 beta-galactosidase [Halalkalibacter okhensis]